MTKEDFRRRMLAPGRIEAVSLRNGDMVRNILFSEARADHVRFVVSAGGTEQHLQFRYEDIETTFRS